MRAPVTALTTILAGTILAATAAVAADPFEGRWTAISAEENGASAPDLIGHRLDFDGAKFRIIDADGKLAFAGTYTADTTAKPATIDFENTEGAASGTTWSGIWREDGQLLTVVDNAPDPRARGLPNSPPRSTPAR